MNMHVSNALAAIYLATGQDVACVSENALGSMDMEVRNGEDLYASLTMPSLTVGTIGGGTGLGQQRRNLELLGCVGENSSKMLAEIVCAAALGLELSLGASVLTNEFAHVHDQVSKEDRPGRQGIVPPSTDGAAGCPGPGVKIIEELPRSAR